VILSVGAVWKSEYELYAHTAAAREAGIQRTQSESWRSVDYRMTLATRRRSHKFLHGNFQPSIVLTGLFTARPSMPFGQQGLVDIIYLTGIYHIVCALLNAFEIPVPVGGLNALIQGRQS